MQVWHKDLLSRVEGMANNGVGLDLSNGHGEVDADAAGILVGLEVFERLKYCAAWLRERRERRENINFYRLYNLFIG